MNDPPGTSSPMSPPSPHGKGAMAIRRILVVCTGNICRSPMAEGFLREAIAADPHLRARGIEIRSAGIHGWDGSPASTLAVEVMRQREVEISGHRSQPMSEELAAWADLILTMTAAQRTWIQHAFPEADGKVMRLAEYSGGTGDIGDPYGGDPGEYAWCADTLAALVPGVLARLARSIHEEACECSGLSEPLTNSAGSNDGAVPQPLPPCDT